MDQTSLQNLHTQLSKEGPVITPGSPDKQTEEHSENPALRSQKARVSDHVELQETRASKRLCLPGIPDEPTDHDLFKTLVEKVSHVLQTDTGETVAELYISIQ